MTDLPKIVLVHGAWADGSCWSDVIQNLQAKGYDVTAPQFPLTSLDQANPVTSTPASSASRPSAGAAHGPSPCRRSERRITRPFQNSKVAMAKAPASCSHTGHRSLEGTLEPVREVIETLDLENL